MASWSRIVSENIPEVRKRINVEKIVLPEVKTKIVVQSDKLTCRREDVRYRLLSIFKWHLAEFYTYKNGYVDLEELYQRVNYGFQWSRISKEDIIYIVSNSYGTEFEFHPSNKSRICHVLSKDI